MSPRFWSVFVGLLTLACSTPAPRTSSASARTHSAEPATPAAPPSASTSSPPAPVDTDRDGIPDSSDRCPTRPGPRLPGTEGCPSIAPPENVLVLGPICFEKNKAELFRSRDRILNENNRSELEGARQYLRLHPEVRMVLRGRSAYGEPKHLARERANAGQKFLIEHGIDPSRLEVEALPESEPPEQDYRERRCMQFKVIEPDADADAR